MLTSSELTVLPTQLHTSLDLEVGDVLIMAVGFGRLWPSVFTNCVLMDGRRRVPGRGPPCGASALSKVTHARAYRCSGGKQEYSYTTQRLTTV